MANPIKGRFVAQAILDALGIKSKLVTAVRIEMPLDGISKVVIEEVITKEDAEKIVRSCFAGRQVRRVSEYVMVDGDRHG